MANIYLNDSSITFYCNAVSSDSEINFITTGYIDDYGKYHCSKCEVNFINCDNVTINGIYNNKGLNRMYATEDDNGHSFSPYSITIGELMAYSLKFSSGTFEYPFRNMYDNIVYNLVLDYNNDCADKTSYFPHLQEVTNTFNWMSGTIEFNDTVNMLTITGIGSSTHCDNLIVDGDVRIEGLELLNGTVNNFQIDKPVYIGEIAIGRNINININTFSKCTYIGYGAFFHCNVTQNGGSTLTLHGQIAEAAFLKATGFDTINIAGVSDIGRSAFSEIPSLINIKGFRGGYSGGTSDIFYVGKPYSSINLLHTYVEGSGTYNWEADNRYCELVGQKYIMIKLGPMDNTLKLKLTKGVGACNVKLNDGIYHTGLTSDLQTHYTGAFVKVNDRVYQFTDIFD